MFQTHPLRYLAVFLLLLFVWSCAAPPAPIDKPAKSAKTLKKSEKAKKKKSVVKKKARKKPRPKPKPKPEPVPMVTEVPEEQEELSGEDPVAGDVNSSDDADSDEVTFGRMMFHYDYYPDTEVYYDTIRHLYFYRDSGKWVMSVALPTSYRADGPSVRLKLKTGQPYTLHRDHRELYPGTGEGRF